MENPFKQNKDFVNTPKRNTFGLDFANNLTFNMGELIPCMCQEVLPGDSFEIDPYVALRFQPTVFPVQTKCRGYIHFFYQRNKNIWKNWNDFQAANKESVLPGVVPGGKGLVQPPYINQGDYDTRFGTGSISDYLGVPSVAHKNVNKIHVEYFYHNDYGKFLPIFPYLFPEQIGLANLNEDASPLSREFEYSDLTTAFSYYINKKAFKLSDVASKPFGSSPKDPLPYDVHVITLDNSRGSYYLEIDSSDSGFYLNLSDNATLMNHPFIVVFSGDDYISAKAESIIKLDYSATYDENNKKIHHLTCNLNFLKTEKYHYLAFYIPHSSTSSVYPDVSIYGLSVDSSVNPRFNVENGMPLNALPYRVYESIYNSFYRDQRNNPYFLDGEVQYNKYCKDDDGLDDFNYRIYHRNWELDRFTSCVQSPQQGVAPLVGISSLGSVSFQSLEDGKTYTMTTETASDADTITKVNITDNVPNSVARAAINLSTSGISINDFRNVNAYQRWKETNIRRGFKIKDQIKARWGVDIKESLLDMPEFLGGISFDVNINTVNQTNNTELTPLGSYAGQMTAFGNSQNKINCYCDQHGYIMAIISVVPTPCYGQVIPKHFFKFNPLDYFNPEFGQIGMQSVPYKELLPLEAEKEDLERTFGYQRPWYEYLSNVDEVHGLFRSELRNFVLTREFVGLPQLNEEFLTVNHNSLNNIFSIDTGHKILGQIKFNIVAKRPIPSISVPSLE